MSDTWDAEDYEPEEFQSRAAPSDRWEGEDEEDVKESWEDEDDAEKKEAQPQTDDQKNKAYQRKKKKLADRIAEKQAAKAKQEQEKEEAAKPLSPEEELAEKLRREKIQKENDLKLAKEAFGIEVKGIDMMYPETEAEYKEFETALKTKISFFEKSRHYVPFLEQLFTDLVVSLAAEDVKKLSTNLTNIYHEKQKQQKEVEKKKKKKKNIVLKSERDTDFGDLAAAGYGDYNDYNEDDFI